MKQALLACGLALSLLTACSSNSRLVENDEYGDWRASGSVRQRPLGSSAGIVVFGTDKEREEATAANGNGTGVNVNAYLWRGALDTLSFMPIASADPFGGTIITDWYSPPSAQNERFRAQALLMGRQLRSDGVKVQVFRQVQQSGNWVDAPVSASTGSDLEDKVLARARELRSQSAGR
jgi:Domain of unknown function (DUF3576)